MELWLVKNLQVWRLICKPHLILTNILRTPHISGVFISPPVYLYVMEYVITESQLFKTMGKLFDTLYPRTRYKKTKTKWYVYHGDKLSANYDYSNNGHKDPSVIMEYYPNKDLLYVTYHVYWEMFRYYPALTESEYTIKFFEKWFTDNFGITPKDVRINDKSYMDKFVRTNS